jgi:hypothetical protein
MLTTPDGSDAAAALPPISGPGPNPNGFFADCNPAAGFDGTRPIAEYFNELIVNLRELLRQGHVLAPVKGDPSLVWKAVLGLLVISTSVTLNVAPTGTPTPVNPFGGDAFDSLLSAYKFLAQYRIVPTARVTIRIAAGTYTATAIVTIDHPNGGNITIAGVSQAATILKFTGLIGGLRCTTAIGMLQDLTIQGDSTQTTPSPWLATGLNIAAGAIAVIQNLTIRDFAGWGLVVDGAQCSAAPGTTITVQTNKGSGVYITNSGQLNCPNVTFIVANNAATTGGNVLVTSGILTADTVSTTGGQQGLVAQGSGTQITLRRLQCEAPANTVGVSASLGAILVADTGAVAGDWYTWNTAGGTARNFFASTYAFMQTNAALSAANRGNTSPAVNTLGNTQAYIQAT